MKYFFPVTLTLIVVCAVCSGEEKPMQDKKYIMIVPKFVSPDTADVDKTVNETAAAYHDAVKDIANQLDQKDLSNEAKVYCCYLLGTLRAPYAVSVLLIPA